MSPKQSNRRSLVDELTSKGVRLTAQRRALIEIMQEAEDHLDASSLLSLARKREPGIHRETVYRTIEKLKSLGLIDELDLMHMNGEKHYYEVRPHRDHIHLACLHCGGIEEFSSPTFEELKHEMASITGFKIQAIRVEVGGLCSKCGTKKQEREQSLQ